MIQLKQILEDIQIKNPMVGDRKTLVNGSPTSPSEETSKMSVDDKRKLSEMVSKYNEYGKSIYREKDIVEIANRLQEITNLAEGYALNECGDWFEESTVKRNMMELRKYNESFVKIAKESQSRQRQLEALYEDMGRVLERYFEISN
jgi:DNA repair ATPase RecN